MNQNPATTPTGCRYSVNGIEMHVLIAGSGPDVLLLHGFPDSHKLWRYQVPALVAAGFRVIAPDLRGYGLTEIPKGGVTAYRMDQLVADVVSLLNVLGVAKVRLVGHDWGAAIGWQPQYYIRTASIATSPSRLDIPHPLKEPVSNKS